ncbi:serine/threonine-protein kinase [Gemmatimonas sp.]|uniref:serine/threonine-protein kinase n=1 Tax=Gemmatimonas sp. TaxID=1962908 RepID=UPI0022C656B2|nr:serine/threonine-protein kinase [Gemmatimonas sp.]MCZ8206305.1 serine/threonine-protein kinase [Gemmatimonas sp.]
MAIETLVGTTMAGYTVRGKVGEGGTATVFRADHPTHGTVALKVLREKLQHDKTAVARFLREAQFGARVEHPNIVRTLDYGQSDTDRYYLAIEWAGGEILDKYAEKSGSLPCKEVAAIMAQICGAVQAAHDVGIVHRDLKPENIMYDPAARQVKLLDFGIAADTEAAPDQRLTRAGFFVGTLMYVAPEALSGELVGPAADQYSLATIAYYLLSGCLPYTGKSPRELFSQLLTQPPVSLNKAKPSLAFPAAVEAVVMKALSKTPAERYPSVMAFSDAFSDAANAEVTSSGAAPATAANDAGKDKGGLFGKMKGLFGR